MQICPDQGLWELGNNYYTEQAALCSDASLIGKQVIVSVRTITRASTDSEWPSFIQP